MKKITKEDIENLKKQGWKFGYKVWKSLPMTYGEQHIPGPWDAFLDELYIELTQFIEDAKKKELEKDKISIDKMTDAWEKYKENNKTS